MEPLTAPDVIVFDMDGVLVEVGESYRETIRQTVKHFAGRLVSHDEIQDLKNSGGWNNDWLLAHRLIADAGVRVEYSEVVDYFNRVFMGEDGVGLIAREKWIPSDDLLEHLSQHATLAIFTGRARFEADATLQRNAEAIQFDPIVTDDSVPKPKPAPDGLELIKQHHPGKQLWYLGDTIDDAWSARDAKVPFIGVSMKANPRHADVTKVLRDNGAFTVLDDINQLLHLVESKRAK